MIKQTKIFVSSLLAVLVLIQVSVVECGFGKAFAGSLAGTVIGRAITNGNTVKHQHHYVIPPATTVERRETLANGCYKQIVREPDMSHVGRFIATEQMICPPPGQVVQAPAPVPVPVAVPGVPVPVVPAQPIVPGSTVTVLSSSTGRYSGGMSLMKTSSIVLIVLMCLGAYLI